MAAVGKAEENGYAERFMRTIKEEEVDLSEYRDFADAYHQIGIFIEDVYMTKRIHSSLGYLTPAEFEASYWMLSAPAAVESTPFKPFKSVQFHGSTTVGRQPGAACYWLCQKYRRFHSLFYIIKQGIHFPVFINE